MTWDDLRIVLAVFRTGNATAAAAQLKVSHATISRRIGEIEAALDIVLVDRTGQRWRPTPICEMLAAQAEKMEHDHEEALRLANAFSSELTGPVYISAPTGVVQSFLAEALAPLATSAPQISLIILTEDELSDISGRKADLAVRFTRTPDPDLIGEQVALNQFGFYAAASVCEAVKAQIRCETLPNVPLLTSDRRGGFPDWATGKFCPKSSKHYVYGFEEKAVMAEYGFGLTMLPRFVGDRKSGLRLLSEIPCDLTVPLWVLANSDTRASLRIATVKRALIGGLKGMSHRFTPPP